MNTGRDDGTWPIVGLLGAITDEVRKIYPGLSDEEALKLVAVAIELLDNRPEGVSLGEAFSDRMHQEIVPGEKNWASQARFAILNRRSA